MSKSLKKGPFVAEHLYKKCLKAQETKNKKVIKTWSRASMILPEFVGLNIGVHNGKKFIPVSITENLVGHKLGEFSLTRNYKGHTSKNDSKSNKIDKRGKK